MPYKDLGKMRAVVRTWKKDHPAGVREQQRRHRATHCERLRASFRVWRKANLEKLSTYQRDWKKNHPEETILRNAVHKVLGARKLSKYQRYVGCTPEFLRGYLEARFKQGMTWNNYGQWHVDHIIPLSGFNFEAHPGEMFIASHYTNLQPLWAEENQRKNRIEQDINRVEEMATYG